MDLRKDDQWGQGEAGTEVFLCLFKDSHLHSEVVDSGLRAQGPHDVVEAM